MSQTKTMTARTPEVTSQIQPYSWYIVDRRNRLMSYCAYARGVDALDRIQCNPELAECRVMWGADIIEANQ